MAKSCSACGCLVFAIASVVLAMAAIVGVPNWWVIHEAKPFVFHATTRLPTNDVALVLGTSPKTPGGYSNPFFQGRIETAARLYREHKVRHLLLSGDNGQRTYDEPTAMRAALIAHGVPAHAITLDYAGFRTLDSVARARAVFGLERCTIVTDDFHVDRAVFLARAQNLGAIGFPSPPVPLRWSVRTRTREFGSRVKAWLDVYVLHTKPKFFGPPVTIDLGKGK